MIPPEPIAPQPQPGHRAAAARLRSFLIDSVDARRVRVFECLFTVAFLVWISRCFLIWEAGLISEGSRLVASELASLGYPAPWPLLEPWQVPVFGLAVLASALLLLWPQRGGAFAGQSAVGPFAPLWLRRIGLGGLFICALYAHRVDPIGVFPLDNLFVGVYALLAVAPGMHRDEGSGRLLQSAAPLRVLQATLMLHYFASGLAKAGGDWLKYNDVFWSQVQGVQRTDAAAWALRAFPKWVWALQQHFVFLFELLAPVLFCARGLLPAAFVLGLCIHVILALLMRDLIYFSTQMLAFYVLFVPDRLSDAMERFAVRARKAFSDLLLRFRRSDRAGWGRIPAE